MYEVSGQEVQFALKVEELLSSITIPEYRQVIVEVGFHSPLLFLLENMFSIFSY